MAQKEVYRQKAAGGRESRIRGGMALYRERGNGIVAYLDGTHGVPSGSEEGLVYEVDLEGGTCGCEDFRYRGKACKHVYCCELWAARHPAPFEAPASRRRIAPAPSEACRRAQRKAAA